jgi:hypothetical protein
VGYSTQFWGPGPISTVCDPRYTIGAGLQNSSFSHILAVFVGYNTQFWVPERYLLFVTPGTRLEQGQNSSFSHILAVFVGNNTQFWGSRPISIVRDPRYMIGAGRQNSMVSHIWPVSWAITHSFGVPVRFPLFVTPVDDWSRSSKLVVFAYFGCFRGL